MVFLRLLLSISQIPSTLVSFLRNKGVAYRIATANEAALALSRLDLIGSAYLISCFR